MAKDVGFEKWNVILLLVRSVMFLCVSFSNLFMLGLLKLNWVISGEACPKWIHLNFILGQILRSGARHRSNDVEVKLYLVE